MAKLSNWRQLRVELWSEENITIRKTDYETGVVTLELYFEAGKLHRDPKEGPAQIHRHRATDQVLLETYNQHGKLHRYWQEGAAYRQVQTDAQGLPTGIVHERYYSHGRLDHPSRAGPAYIVRDEKRGIVLEECYYEDGRILRNLYEGPAEIIRYSSDGSIQRARYFRKGRLLCAHSFAEGEMSDAQFRQDSAHYSRLARPKRPPSRRSSSGPTPSRRLAP